MLLGFLPHPRASALRYQLVRRALIIGTLIQVKSAFSILRFSAPRHAAMSERIMAQATITYLEGRYAALEKEIADALRHSPTNDLAVADLRSRKLIIADEIQHNRRLVERFSKLSAH
jgi:hypothetical protein